MSLIPARLAASLAQILRHTDTPVLDLGTLDGAAESARESAVLPVNYRMAEIVLELPDARYRYLTVADKLDVMGKTRQKLYRRSVLGRVLYHLHSEADGVIVQCEVVDEASDRPFAVATVQLSAMLLEDGNFFLAIGRFAERLGAHDLACSHTFFADLNALGETYQRPPALRAA